MIDTCAPHKRPLRDEMVFTGYLPGGVTIEKFA
jgi:hypothetical protein